MLPSHEKAVLAFDTHMLHMPTPNSLPLVSLLAATESVQHRITSGFISGFSQWWHMPALVVLLATVVVFMLWLYRRDAGELPPQVGLLLATLRIGVFAALVAAYLDFERTAEHELIFPSRVAVLIDASASMTLDDAFSSNAESALDQSLKIAEPLAKNGAPETPRRAVTQTRSQRAIDILDEGGLLAALASRHEVSVWRFETEAEPLLVLPMTDPLAPPSIGHESLVGKTVEGAISDGSLSAVNVQPPASSADGPSAEDWRRRLTPEGFETRIGESLIRVFDQEPAGVLAAVLILSDGSNNAGIDPAMAVAALAKAGVPVFPIGIGSDRLPTNVRVSDLLAPVRVFPGDRFAVTGYLQSQGLTGQTVKVELFEADSDETENSLQETPDSQSKTAPRARRLIDDAEVVLGADGELSAVRFDVPGLESPGRCNLLLRVVPPVADRTVADNLQVAEIEVVDRVTQVLLMAGGPSREYQFMRNVLDRDKSFAVDVLLGTANRGSSQDARSVLESFPATAEALAEYDVVVAFDYDWRQLDPAAQSRLDRWVSRDSGGLVLVAGNVFMDAWLADPQTSVIRNLHPVELRRPSLLMHEELAGLEEPMPLIFTRDAQEAEFLWLGSSRIASQTVWSDFKGVFSCLDATIAKPGATVYARASHPHATASQDVAPIYFAGQFFGSGNVFFLGSGETWRLRELDDSLFERLTTQLIRHVSQGRLLRGSRQARVLIDRDRFAVGSNVVVRVVAAEGNTETATCQVVGPDGTMLRIALTAQPSQPGVVQGAFVASREGTWRIDAELGNGSGEKMSRRIQARLPDRELAQPRLDRRLLEQVAVISGSQAHFLCDQAWTVDASQTLAEKIPDRSRREFETGVPDGAFKRQLNTILLAFAAGLLCVEWVVRRLVKLA